MEYCLCFAMTKVMLLVFFMATSASASSSALSSTYYDSTCPKALETVKSVVKSAVAKEKRMGASLLRLHFHDCFVNGCDASVLLDDTSTFTGEKSANPNANSIRGFSVVDDVKSQLESVCAGVVSCADILAIAARDAVVELGGPSWTVPLGRRDSLTANMTAANTQIPGPTSNLSTLISSFSAQGLSTYEMVALSGSHTVGQGRCKNFRSRIYNDTDINSFYASSLQSNCSSDSGDDNLSPLDAGTPTEFDTSYYTHLLYMEGLLHSDQQLYSGDGSGSTDSLVRYYSFAKTKFFSDFASAMVKMGNISPLTGSNGEIRTNCRTPNSAS